MHSAPVEKIQQFFIQNEMTLSLAESCTGGEVAATLTKLSGCSNYFLGSVVAYSNDMKEKILNVNSQVLQHEGAVSAAVVLQMAEGVLHLSSSDFSLAVSGIAGPDGGTADKPVGTIWAAICHKSGRKKVWSFYLRGDRKEIIKKSVQRLLEQLYSFIQSSNDNENYE